MQHLELRQHQLQCARMRPSSTLQRPQVRLAPTQLTVFYGQQHANILLLLRYDVAVLMMVPAVDCGSPGAGAGLQKKLGRRAVCCSFLPPARPPPPTRPPMPGMQR